MEYEFARRRSWRTEIFRRHSDSAAKPDSRNNVAEICVVVSAPNGQVGQQSTHEPKEPLSQ
jgi:hypothetical protein